MGTAKITVTTADGNFTAEKTITVGKGADKTLLNEVINEAEEYKKLNEIYTAESYEALVNALEAAEAVVDNEDATEQEVSNNIIAVRNAISKLEERATVEEDKISYENVEAIDATSEADQDYKENAVDGNEGSIWHSGYQAVDTLPVSITLKLDKVYELDQMDYLPRQNSRNGHVTKYKIETSLDGENWIEARVGNLEANKAGTALADLGYHPMRFNSVEAQYVRFTSLETLGDTNNKYASVAELVFYGREVEEEVVVNKDALQGAIDIAKEITEEQLNAAIPEAREEFVAALAEAEEILASEEATQEQVDTALDRLNKAIKGLEILAGDKTKLIELVETINALDSNNFTSDTWSAVELALIEANNVIANENATVGDVTQAYSKLSNAYSKLEEKVDKTELEEVINKAEALDSSKYTEESYALVLEKLAIAKDVMAKEDASKESVKAAIAALNDAIDNLKEVDDEEDNDKVETDKSSLYEAIVKGQGIQENEYTSESFKNLKVKLDKAISVHAKENATQEEIDSVTSELLAAIDALVKVDNGDNDGDNNGDNNGDNEQDQVVNKELLNGLINNALNLDGNKYTSETWSNLMSSLKVAQEVMAREDVTQDEVNKAYDTLNVAIEGLVEASNKPGDNNGNNGNNGGSNNGNNGGSNNGSNNGNNNGNNSGDLPSTGGTPAGAVGILGALTAALGFGIFKKKRK